MMKMIFLVIGLVAVSAWDPIVQLTEGVEAPNEWIATRREVDVTERVNLHIALTRSNIHKLKEFYEITTEPTSPKFGQWMTQDELTVLLAPPRENIEAVMDWLKSLDITKTRLDVNKDYIHFTCSVKQAEQVIGQKVVVFQNKKTGQTLLKAVAPIRVPRSIARLVDTIVGLSGFPVQRFSTVSRNQSPELTEITPSVLIQRYNVTTVQKANTTNRQAVAEFQGQYISQTDVCTFYKDFNLNGSCTIGKIIGKNDPSEPGVESSLDVDYMQGLSDQTTLDYYIAAGMDFCSDLLTWTSDISNQQTPGWVHSVSYGEQKHKRVCPEETMNRLDQDFMKLNTRGISFVIASGDSGSGWWARDGYNLGYLCPSWPASSEYVTAVGSTYFYRGNKNEEEATTQFGSGGGFSFWHTQPSWQQAAVKTYLASQAGKIKGKFNKNGRATPDVSAMGEQFTIVINGRKEAGIGGTSASTPTFAGIVSRLNDLRLNAGKTTIGGGLNKIIYANPSMFYDVTLGSDRIGLNAEHGFDCAIGWDPVSGMGTPNFPAMAKVVGDLP